MFIYLITNLINQKKYIGITTQKNPFRRWIEHKSKASKNKKLKIPLYNSIRKHGVNNFKFEVIEKLDDIDIDLLLTKETEKILEFNSLAPNGYNLKIKSSFRVMSKELSKKMSKTHQGSKRLNKTCEYIGVYINRCKKSFSCEISFLGRKYKKVFVCPIEAAKTYDMMAIYLYGPKCKTNFNKLTYTDSDIKKCFNGFYERSNDFYTSKYKGIYFSKSRDCYRARYKGKYVGQAKTEDEMFIKLQEYIKKNEQ